MNHYIVCDAGGTKADFILFDAQGRFFARHQSFGANAIFTGQEAAQEAVIEGIRSCLKKSGLTLREITNIVLFIPGFRPCLEPLKSELNYSNILLQGDEENAFYGALGKEKGIVVLSGTGSFAIGKDAQGNEAVCGGWGPLIGDFGSGYHIGVLCLTHIAKQYDEGRNNTVLEQLVLKELNIETVPQLRHTIYKDDFSRSKIASLCKTVEKAARLHDETALLIIQTAANELVVLADTISKRIDAAGLEISLIGGVSNMGELITNRFAERLNKILPQCQYIKSKYSPSIGAVLYVLANIEGCDIQAPEIIQNITKEVDTKC